MYAAGEIPYVLVLNLPFILGPEKEKKKMLHVTIRYLLLKFASSIPWLKIQCNISFYQQNILVLWEASSGALLLLFLLLNLYPILSLSLTHSLLQSFRSYACLLVCPVVIWLISSFLYAINMVMFST